MIPIGQKNELLVIAKQVKLNCSRYHHQPKQKMLLCLCGIGQKLPVAQVVNV
jgi:hypothetical protein